MSYQPKVALVHDDFLQKGGAESLFATIARMWPDAPIYTSLVNWQKFPRSIDRNRIRPSWMQKIPFAHKYYKILLPLYPFAFESFNLNSYDLVISSTTRFSKSVITSPKSTHISYINSTPRFIWDKDTRKDYFPQLILPLINILLGHLKRWDKISSNRTDIFIANSKNVSFRIKKYYNRNSKVIYPYANTEFFKPAKIHNWELKSKKYFLIVSRLVKWKKIDTAIIAAKELKKNLIIIGEGPDQKRLIKISGKSEFIKFQGKVTSRELLKFYNNSEALIVTQEEDFGIAAVEAQSCAVPVIAFNKGGIKEIIIDNTTGVLYSSQESNALKDAIKKLGTLEYSKNVIRRNALRFSKRKFEQRLTDMVNKYAN